MPNNLESFTMQNFTLLVAYFGLVTYWSLLGVLPQVRRQRTMFLKN